MPTATCVARIKHQIDELLWEAARGLAWMAVSPILWFIDLSARDGHAVRRLDDEGVNEEHGDISAGVNS